MHLAIDLFQPTPPPTAADGRSPELVPAMLVSGRESNCRRSESISATSESAFENGESQWRRQESRFRSPRGFSSGRRTGGRDEQARDFLACHDTDILQLRGDGD